MIILHFELFRFYYLSLRWFNYVDIICLHNSKVQKKKVNKLLKHYTHIIHHIIPTKQYPF
jgi:hypothetical protein